MKKVAILTLNGDDNYGNKLQNYALKYYIENLNFYVDSIWQENVLSKLKRKIKYILYIIFGYKRRLKFLKFNKYLNYNYICDYNKINKYDYVIVGSDQVWNYTFDTFNQSYLLAEIPPIKRISYAASIGIDYLDDKYKKLFYKELIKFKSISVREETAKKVLSDLIKKDDISVSIDPTMLLSADEWDKVSKKPKNLKSKKYILSYFLGELSNERKKEIEKIAKQNECEIINILDKNCPFYETGPSEFLYLEKNAFLICTDSFHASVFAILYNRPFIVFDREQENVVSMNSRIDTLLDKFKLNNRKFEGTITNENLKYNYNNSYKILEEERKKSKEFLEKALDIK